MWVSRSKMESIEKRLAELESWKKYHPDHAHFTIYKDVPQQLWALSMSYFPPHAKIPVQDVVRRILDHLGMKLVYQEGQPERVNIDVTKGSDAAGRSTDSKEG